jgi:hypothetical protein
LNNNLKIEYNDAGRVKSANGFLIAGDKHAYRCKECGAIFQSKNINCRSLFATSDPKCDKCFHPMESISLVCDCKPIIGSANDWRE